MTGTKILLLALLLFLEGVVVTAIDQHSTFDRAVVKSRSLAGDCHCDGDHVHCNEQESEALCHCDNGEVHCSTVAHDCHCDGDHVHCSEAESEGLCHCDGGEVHCDHHAGETGEKDDQDQKVDQQAVQEDDEKPWAEVIVSSLIVNLVTLIGVVIVGGEFVRKIFCPKMAMDQETQRDVVKNYIPMFACGALMATVFLLILPEALHLIESGLKPESACDDDHSGHNHRHLAGDEEEYEESMATWRWGVSVMAGFMIPVVIHALLTHSHDDEEGVPASTGSLVASDRTDEENNEVSKLQEQETQEVSEEPLNEKPVKNLDSETKRIDWALFASLAVGDFFHNFADGIFIGTAFLLCHRDIAVTIAGATIAHEVPQEIADYFLMVQQCNMTPLFALAMNFLVGMSIMLGGIIVLAVPDISNTAIGVILAIGGGVYIHIAIFECYVRAEKHQTTLGKKFGGFLGFLLGAIPIGLVLLNHEHCGDHGHCGEH